MQETWVQTLGWEDALEKEKATHSNILESQRIRHDWVIFHFHIISLKEDEINPFINKTNALI